ncbi:MAG TPA: patatin-like phospholipase family protein [Ktedonobacteraceae bacterium]
MTETTEHSSKALILGGGGATGIAWELGVLLGLHDSSVDVTNVELIVGTSAGATAGAQIISALSLEELYARQLRPLAEASEQSIQIDFAALAGIFTAGAGAVDAQTARARVGEAALQASTISEQERLEIITDRLPSQEWSDKQQLVVTAVDAQTGEWVTFHRDSGVPLALAVAASCALPGVYPPVTIQGRRYMDGGVRSGTNADIAQGYKRVLILRAEIYNSSAPENQQNIPYVAFEDELAELLQADVQVLVITPDEASSTARGANHLDASRREVSARAGRAQGRQMAGSVQHFWE